jgi:hypothetical protein
MTITLIYVKFMSYLLISNTTDKKINLNDLDFVSQHIKK